MRRRLLAALLVLIAAGCGCSASAGAERLPDDGGGEWTLAQPEPPEPPVGVEAAEHLVGLGHIGDIEFQAPNRGALITAGNGSTVAPGVWLYNGVRWRELATVCGATDGRIAWAGPDEFWTVSDGRPGQAPSSTGQLPPLEDDTLCRFGVGASGRFEVLGSYAKLAFLSTSYQAMHGAACLSASDCWFGGDPLPAPGVGAFQLHWNGANVVAEPFAEEGHTVQEMRAFEGSIFQSLWLRKGDARIKQEATIPPLRQIVGEAASAGYANPAPAPPVYSNEGTESPFWVAALSLGSDEDSLWAAAGPSGLAPEGREPGIAVARFSRRQWSEALGEYVETGEPTWAEVTGPNSSPTGKQALGEEMDVQAIAAEPNTNSAWIALDTESDFLFPRLTAQGLLARITANGTVSDRLALPEPGDTLGPKGAVLHLACPAEHDCWAVTAQGWLFHLGVEGEVSAPADGPFAELAGELPITQRPADEGVPPVPPDALPEDTSGEGSGGAESIKELLKSLPSPFATVTLPLLSGVHTRLRGTTLELRFRLTVKAQVRLVAKRKKVVVASTRRQTLQKGPHRLALKLDPKRWPTKLDLQTHALAKLPTTTTRESNTGTIGTSEIAPVAVGAEDWSRLP